MFFYRRDPYYEYSPAAGCFGSLLASLIIAAIIIVCAIYIGIYVLLGLLIIGVLIGGVTAVFALFKALPQTISDMSSQIYRGNKIVVSLKKTGYFFVCLAKYSVSNDLQYARNAYQKFTAKRVLSFSKWVNFALAVAVLIFGLLILVAILFFAALSTAALIMLVISIAIIAIAIMFGVGFLYNMFFVVKEAIHSGKQSFTPVCFKFVGRCSFSDLLLIPKTFIKQMWTWIVTTWRNSMNLLSKYRLWLNTKRWILFPLSVAFIISCPVLALIVIALASLIILISALLVYLIDAIWILIKSIFRF